MHILLDAAYGESSCLGFCNMGCGPPGKTSCQNFIYFLHEVFEHPAGGEGVTVGVSRLRHKILQLGSAMQMKQCYTQYFVMRGANPRCQDLSQTF